MLYNKINNSKQAGKKLISLLIDPDKYNLEKLHTTIDIANSSNIDFFLVGSSFLTVSVDNTIEQIKKSSRIPVFLFPGNVFQVSDKADGILFLSLISGRNPELLIGQHVIAAPFIKNSGIEVIPTGYMLIESGKQTSVEYASNTKPIPRNKPDIASCTAIAGELLGLKMLYLEAGSGADFPVSKIMIEKVKQGVKIPLIVGGGLNTTEKVKTACEAGADVIVVGNAIEDNQSLIGEFSEIVNGF